MINYFFSCFWRKYTTRSRSRERTRRIRYYFKIILLYLPWISRVLVKLNHDVLIQNIIIIKSSMRSQMCTLYNIIIIREAVCVRFFKPAVSPLKEKLISTWKNTNFLWFEIPKPYNCHSISMCRENTNTYFKLSLWTAYTK